MKHNFQFVVNQCSAARVASFLFTPKPQVFMSANVNVRTRSLLFYLWVNYRPVLPFHTLFSFFITARCPGSVTHSEPSPTDMADLSTTPPRILQLHHPIQFIAIPDTPGYPIVQALSFSPPVIGLPIPNSAATPTYILGKFSSHFLFFGCFFF